MSTSTSIHGVDQSTLPKKPPQHVRDEHRKAPTSTALTVARLLKHFSAAFVLACSTKATNHVQSILSRLALCRTCVLGRHWLSCKGCDEHVRLYNSCAVRCCPQCGGGKRHSWLERTASMIVPGVDYFQIVLTVGDSLDELVMANRRIVYSHLMRAAWKAVDRELKRLAIDGGAIAVLHTWNQRMLSHPHIHMILPAGGLSLDWSRWVGIDDATRRDLERRLSKRFRDFYLKGMASLHRRGKLDCRGIQNANAKNAELASAVHSPESFKAHLQTIAPSGFNVRVQPPPAECDRPEAVLKYVARYITGGPISDSRLVGWRDGQVTFKARSLKRPGSSERREMEPVTIGGVEFVRRWCLHIPPQRLQRVRYYGGLSHPRRRDYLAACRRVLGSAAEADDSNELAWQEERERSNELSSDVPSQPVTYRCPKCQRVMEVIESEHRPSWRDVLHGPDRPWWYRSGTTARPPPEPAA